mgnify:CR=1 FL=1
MMIILENQAFYREAFLWMTYNYAAIAVQTEKLMAMAEEVEEEGEGTENGK